MFSLKKRKGQSKNERGERKEEEKTEEERKWRARCVKDRGNKENTDKKENKIFLIYKKFRLDWVQSHI